MSEKQVRQVNVIRNLTAIVWISGFAAFLFGFFESGIKQDYVFSISLGVMFAAVMIFGFCYFIQIMAEVSEKQRKVQISSKFQYKKSIQVY